MPSAPRMTTIELFKEDMKFSAGHFTIFSASHRENLHGHNFTVQLSFRVEILENGMSFDYGVYKRRILELCHAWNEVVLLPERSPFLRLGEEGAYIAAEFGGERMLFLRRDVLLLPVENITIEELSGLFLARLLAASDAHRDGIHGIEARIFSGPGQCAVARWSREDASS